MAEEKGTSKGEIKIVGVGESDRKSNRKRGEVGVGEKNETKFIMMKKKWVVGESL